MTEKWEGQMSAYSCHPCSCQKLLPVSVHEHQHRLLFGVFGDLFKLPLFASQVSLTVLPKGSGTVSVNPGKNVDVNGGSATLTA